MIREDYVSFETAKLLKDKGFDWECIGYYVDDEPNDVKYSFLGETNSTWETRCCSAPTLQMARKWLREKYYIHADPIQQGNYNDCSEYYTWIVARMGIIHRNSGVAEKLSYEEACEAALKYSLENLI